ncbi:MAG: UPF0182 family protein [Candidatus Bathyarchaeia archaeon]
MFPGEDERPADEERGGVPYARRLRWVLIAAVVVVILALSSSSLLTVWLNVTEFGELFIRPLYFEVLSGLILAPIAFLRVDFLHRRSLTWWIVSLLRGLYREHLEVEGFREVFVKYDFRSFKMPPVKFALWQATKVLVGMLFLRDLLFGMAVQASLGGWNPGLSQLWKVFAVPFVTPSLDKAYAYENVVPMIPALTLLTQPLMIALTVRLLALVAATQVVGILMPGRAGERVSRRSRKASLLGGERLIAAEALAALACFWIMFNLFLPPLLFLYLSPFINYNTRYVIAGFAAGGVYFTFLALHDHLRAGSLGLFTRRRVAVRVMPVILIVLVTGSIVAVNNSIADARKVEWLGPYVSQLVYVNRYLAELDDIVEVPYNFSVAAVPPSRIDAYIAENRVLISKVRLWDWEAAFAKLKPEIGLIPYIDFQDSDILRFNGSLYWSASMKPVLPGTVRPEDRWYSEKFYYTHIPTGFLFLDAHGGGVVNASDFIQQRRIYYGEGGLLSDTWAAYPVGRTRSDELGGAFYGGGGGVDIPPPLSWVFDPTFFLAYRDTTIHVMRYRDVYDRMQLLFPYFVYSELAEKAVERVDMLPVTDGESTYWLMPLIASLDTVHVPWSGASPFKRLTGYALIDIYHGSIQVIVLGDDFFSELFKRAYADYVTTEVPDWLKGQLRYPEELFEYRVSRYNFFHVLDPSTFIVGKEFFEVPAGLDTYYVFSKPPGFDRPEFVGLLSLELRGAGGRNLAGYMVVRNEYPAFGQMIFYQVPLESTVKLLGPSAVLEALEKNPDFAQLKTLLRTPRIGDNILYRVGEHDVYFIPVYTAGAGGVVTEMGVVAAVGATFTGSYQVGLGNTAEAAFRALLAQQAGVEPPTPTPPIDREQRKSAILRLFEESNLTVLQPLSVNPHVSFTEGAARYVAEEEWEAAEALVNAFIQQWGMPAGKVLMWSEDSQVNFGVLVNVGGVVELHSITIDLG